MKSIYDVINESKNVEFVWVVKGPDGTIASVWPTKNEAEEDAKRFNVEVQGNVFSIERDEIAEFVKD